MKIEIHLRNKKKLAYSLEQCYIKGYDAITVLYHNTDSEVNLWAYLIKYSARIAIRN